MQNVYSPKDVAAAAAEAEEVDSVDDLYHKAKTVLKAGSILRGSQTILGARDCSACVFRRHLQS